MSPFGYRGYGLDLVSEIELPEYLPADAAGDPDVRILLDPAVRAAWQEAGGAGLADGAVIAAPGGGHLFRIASAAVYLVRDGREIRVGVEPDADPGLVRLFTIGSAMGLALHQRGAFVLHGATVVRDGRARIVVGDSGAGKSTLAAHLVRAGCAVFGDDTMAVWDAATGGGKRLWPGSRVFKLWTASAEALGVEPAELTPIGNRSGKFYVPNPLPPSGDSAGLVEILVLEVDDGGPRVEPLDGLEALQAVARNTYRPEFVGLMGREPAHFRQCGALVAEVPVRRLVRPWDLGRIGETVDLLLRRWDADGDRARGDRAAAPGQGG